MSIGNRLRQKREEQNLSLEQMAERTHIRIPFLEAIENERYDELPSQTQVRGFTKLYAAALGLDLSDLLERQPSHDDSPVEDGDVEASSLDQPPATAKKQQKPLKETQSKKRPQKPVGPDEWLSPSQAIFTSIGKMLANQREALGLSRDDVEKQIKIREFFLYSLEMGNIDDLPSTVQGRGMLNNYAAFMNLDTETIQVRYAEALNLRRLERQDQEVVEKKSGKPVLGKAPLIGWRRFLTPDLIVGGGVLIILFALVIWGANQVIKTSRVAAEPTINSISEILLATPAIELSPIGQTGSPELDITETPLVQVSAAVDLQATITSLGNATVQVVVVAYQRAFMQVYVDGREVFTGRVVPGTVYNYSGSTKITLLTGNAGALQVYYNQVDQGILGPVGEVLSLEFSAREMVTPTPRFTATTTRTSLPTMTLFPTQTPQPTATESTVTITPLVPGN